MEGRAKYTHSSPCPPPRPLRPHQHRVLHDTKRRRQEEAKQNGETTGSTDAVPLSTNVE